jgi:hypothetical protein
MAPSPITAREDGRTNQSGREIVTEVRGCRFMAAAAAACVWLRPALYRHA